MKLKVNLEILGNETEVEIEVPNEFESLSDFEQMEYIEKKVISKINYSWDY